MDEGEGDEKKFVTFGGKITLDKISENQTPWGILRSKLSENVF